MFLVWQPYTVLGFYFEYLKRVSYPYIICVKHFVRFISRIVLSVWQIYFRLLCFALITVKYCRDNCSRIRCNFKKIYYFITTIQVQESTFSLLLCYFLQLHLHTLKKKLHPCPVNFCVLLRTISLGIR